MSTRLLATVSPGEIRVALLRDGVLAAYAVDRPGRPDGLGDLHRARVTAIAPAMSGAFVALAGDAAGFLPETEAPGARQPIARAVQEGMLLPVRVTRAAQGGKGARVSARLSETEAAVAAAAPAGAPLLLARGPEVVLRLARRHPETVVETDGAGLAARLRGAIGAERVRLSPMPVFDEALEAEVAGLADATVAMPGGGVLLFHPTPALVAIDVDAGGAAGSRDAAAHARVNQAAIVEIARQVVLRELAGPILIDFAGQTARQRQALAPAIAAAFADDNRTEPLGIGPLGLAELRRRRETVPLHEVLGGPAAALTHGLAALRQAAREAAATPARAWALRAAPAVLAALAADPVALAEFAAGAGRALVLRPDPALGLGDEAIEHAG